MSERDVVRQLHTYGASVPSRPVAKIIDHRRHLYKNPDTVDKISADDRKTGSATRRCSTEETGSASLAR